MHPYNNPAQTNIKSLIYVFNLFLILFFSVSFLSCSGSTSNDDQIPGTSSGSEENKKTASFFFSSSMTNANTFVATPNTSINPSLTKQTKANSKSKFMTLDSSSCEYRTDSDTTGQTLSEVIGSGNVSGLSNITAIYCSESCLYKGSYSVLMQNSYESPLYTITGNSISSVNMEPLVMTYTYDNCIDTYSCNGEDETHDFEGFWSVTISNWDSNPCEATFIYNADDFDLSVDGAHWLIEVMYDLSQGSPTVACEDVTLSCDDHMTEGSWISVSGVYTKSSLCETTCGE